MSETRSSKALDAHRSLVARTPASPGGRCQSLAEHVDGVSKRCTRFVAEFADPLWGLLAACWHDLGKAAPDWQDLVAEATADANEASADSGRRPPPHAPLGAIHAARANLPPLHRQLLAFVIGGHHSGLADYERLREAIRDPEHSRRYESARRVFEKYLPAPHAGAAPLLPAHLASVPTARALEMFTRFVFSCLVDSDGLDAEEHSASTGDLDARHRRQARAHAWPPLGAYDNALNRFMSEKRRLAPATLVNRLRGRVLDACIAASTSPRGGFSLTVPTGGGKTLASLAFALKHAISTGHHRVIIAVPFTAIIDQTASVLRDAFEGLGPDVLVEHHSGLEPSRESLEAHVAAENWDAPLVVTTQVQLFESLFANRASRCRKLHNLANAVIVLDEVQSLPHGVLAPILDVLNELLSHYGTSVLLTTATQPSVHTRLLAGASFAGLDRQPTEIVSESLGDELWASLRRADVRWPTTVCEPGSAEDTEPFWKALAAEIDGHRQVLVIVHLKMDARSLYRDLGGCGVDTFHLSAAMCSAHRRDVLRLVHERLSCGAPCRLVATQLIEAGVDIDFPVVYRAMAGLESLAQSAGRCNREGRLPALGSFRVFEAPTRPPSSLRLHLDIARSMLQADPTLDLFCPATFTRYFDRVYAARDLDSREVQALRDLLRFEATAAAFRMIDQPTQSVVVCWDGQARRLVQQLRHAGPSRALLRALQPYTVSVFPQQKATLERQAALEDIAGYLVLRDFTRNPFYHPEVGLLTDADTSVSLVF